MKGDIRFYIDGRRVDLTKDPRFLYNWELTDFDNPTIMKNSFSKTISIEGTKENNKIFGDIWKLDREQGYGGRSGVNFNPTYRVPFEIYVGGDLFERGYVKLQRVKIDDGKYTYEIGLFGTLGLFLYNLQTDWNTGEKRNLGDLTYYVENTPLLQPSTSFEINKDVVKEAWENIDAYSSKWSVINFAPCYNGLNDKMDTEKAVINFSGQTAFPESIVKDAGTFNSYQGYALATLPRKLVEYEAGDLRSWAQRPVVRVKSVIDAICLPENNRGKFDDGFEVELDPEFFNTRNPYYEDAWMTLPLISTLNITTKGESETPYTANYIAHYSTGVDNMELVYALSQPIDRFGTTAELNFDLLINVPNASAGTEYDKLYPSATYDSGGYMRWTNVYALQGLATTDALQYTKPIDGTPVLWNEYIRTDRRSGETLEYTFSMATSKDVKSVKKGLADYYEPRYYTKTSTLKEGYFVRYSGNNIYRWNSQLSLSIPLPIGTTHFRIRLDRLCNRTRQVQGNMRAFLFSVNHTVVSHANDYKFNGVIEHNNLISNRTFVMRVGDVSNFYTGQEIKIKDLLNTSFSPADFLLDYCKMYGLYLRKDRYKDKIYIETRNTFFQRDDITDISKSIAYDKGVEITPTLCEAKYYGMQNKFDESGTYKDYKNKYGKIYGEKLLNTGWEFDSETKQLINSNFKGAIQTRANGIYYFEPFNDVIRAFYFDGLTYVLYLNGDYTSDTNEMMIGRSSILDTLDPYIPNLPYFDIDDKPDFAGEENKPLDGSSVLLFHQGETDVTAARYYLTDDLDVMQKLCNKPCYIITGCEYDKNGNHIAHKIDFLPHFSRYWTSTNYVGSGSTRVNILYSMDYGSPRQLYLANFVNYEESNLYSQFYQNYFEDIYDVNTRMVTLYYKPNEVLSAENLRKLYYFANSIWRLNRIIDYNPTEKGLVKAEFVKINDTDALTNHIPSQELTLTVVLDRYEIDGNATTITGTVTTSDHGPWSIEGWDYDDSVSISPLSDTTDGTFTVTIPAYYNTIDRTITIVVSAGDLTASVTILQHPLTVSESVSITSTSPIPSTATTIHYNLTSVPSARVDLKSGTTVLATQTKTGTTTGVFNITANTDATAKTYTLYAETPNGGASATTSVVQNASITPEPQTYTIIFDDISVDDDHSDLTGWTIPDGSITLLINGMPAMEIGVQGTQGNLHFTGSTQQQITTSTLGNIQQLNVDYSSMMWNTGLTPDISITTTFNGDFSVTVDNDNNLAGGDTTNIKNWANNSTIHITVVLTIRRR